MEIDKISKLIKKLRKEKKLTQEELGNLIGVSGKAVSKWERGQSLPDVSIIKKLSDNLGISSDELLQGKVNQNKENNKNKKNNYLLIILSVFLLIIMLIIFNYKKEENNLKEKETCTLIRTFYIDDIKNSNDENYLYVTLHEYQVEGVFTIKISKVIGKELEKNNNFEFTFTTPKDYMWETTDKLFNNREIISIEKTDKVGMEQTSKYYC